MNTGPGGNNVTRVESGLFRSDHAEGRGSKSVR